MQESKQKESKKAATLVLYMLVGCGVAEGVMTRRDPRIIMQPDTPPRQSGEAANVTDKSGTIREAKKSIIQNCIS